MKKAFLFFAALTSLGAAAAPLPLPSPDSVVLKERPVRLPPLFWLEKDPEAESRLLMAAMLYWDVRDASSSQRLLFPIFYRWTEGDRRFFISLPLLLGYARAGESWMVAGPFYRKKDREKTQTLLAPIYWQRVRREGGRVTVALPFLWYGYQNRDGTKRDTLVPGGFWRRRGDMTLGFAGPYFWMTDPESRFRVLFPVYWHGRSREEKFDVLGPFYSRWTAEEVVYSTATDRPGRRRVGLFPVVGAGWGRDYASHYLFPLYFRSRGAEGSSFATLPFSRFRRDDQRYGHLGLYFYNRDPDLRVDALFPLWYHRYATDGFERRLQILNFYRSRENEDTFQTLFPLYGYWSDPDGSRFLSWGLWRRRDLDGVSGWAGLYFWKHAAGGDENRILFPLYWHVKRAPDWQVDVLFPLFGRYRDGDTTVTVVPPFISRRSPGRRSLSLFFLYWQDRQGDRGVTTLAPFFLTQYNPDRKSFFSPLLWTRRSRLSREGVLPPVYWYKSTEASRLFVVPVYWRVRTATRDIGILPPFYRWRTGDVIERGLFPLWGRRTARVEEKGVFRQEPRGGYLFPFYWASTDGKGNGTWIVPPILGYVTRSDAGTDQERFAMQYLLLGSVRKRLGELEHGFFPLYQYNRRPDYVNWWAPRILALAAYERKGPDRKGVVFPYFWWRGLEADRSFFLLYYRSSYYEAPISTAAARGEKIGGAATVFPLYWSGWDAAQERRYRYILPFYASDDEAGRRWRLLAPLWVSYNGATGRRFRVFFPLYWRHTSATKDPASEEGEEVSGVPADHRDIAVLGPWYRVDAWRSGVRTRTVGVAPVFSRTYTGPGDKYWEVLGGLFGRDIQSGRRRFRVLWFFYTPAKALPGRGKI